MQETLRNIKKLAFDIFTIVAFLCILFVMSPGLTGLIAKVSMLFVK